MDFASNLFGIYSKILNEHNVLFGEKLLDLLTSDIVKGNEYFRLSIFSR